MRRSLDRLRWAAVGLAVLAVQRLALGDQVAAPVTLVRVMSFNIRYGTARDGDNAWPHRREAVFGVIRRFAPDLLGTQETLAFQRDELLEALPEHAAVAAGRDDGKEAGEMAAVFYRRDRFDPLGAGHLWLSETPEVVGSRGWDAALPRIATWVKLRDRTMPQDAPILFLNAHFDHVGERARLESARLIRRSLATLGAGCRLVVTGDFNAAEASPPYAALFTDAAAGPKLLDTLRVALPQSAGPEGTFNGFVSSNTTSGRIDWIGCSADWRVVAAGIDRTASAGRAPSDHWPVTAILAPH